MSEALAARIRRLRLDRGMSQEALALACCDLGRKVYQFQVCAWERGDYRPSLMNFTAIAKALNVSLDELWEGMP